MKTKHALIFCIAFLSGDLLRIHGQGTALTYQGRLDDNGAAANGVYDLRFTIHDLDSGGNVVGGPLTNSAVGVSNGLFTATLDFGAGAFTGASRWMEVGVRTNGGAGFTPLNPRQRISTTPYAMTAGNVTGVVPNGGLAGTYSSAVTFNNAANSFTGNGAGLTVVNAATLAGLNANQFWKTGGNSGTTPAANFVGTTDNQSLEFRVNGGRALRLQPNFGGGPSVVGGSNTVDAIAPAATIGGGQGNEIRAQGFYSTIGGGLQNIVDNSAQQVVIAGGIRNRMALGANASAIGGGSENVVQANTGSSVIAGGDTNSIGPLLSSASIGGGFRNSIQSGANYSTIGGGRANTIQPNSEYAMIAAGGFNVIQSGAHYSAIVGGNGNTIGTNAQASVIAGGGGHMIETSSSFIGGGFDNAIGTNAMNSVIGGGTGNKIRTNANSSTIAGGTLNRIETDAGFSFIGGGSSNMGESNAYYATISGGSVNVIQRDADHSTISGGSLHTIGTNADHAVIAGGDGNTVAASAAAIGGGTLNLIETNALNAVVAGGGGNFVAADAQVATIGGGIFNTNRGKSSTIAGGSQNVSVAEAATIGGGAQNRASGFGATVPGGGLNIAAGQFSLAAGQRAAADHDGTFVWADGSGPGLFSSSNPNQFLVRAAGGMGIGTATPNAGLHVKKEPIPPGGTLSLEGATHTYLTFFPDGAAAGRRAYFGFASGTTTSISLANEFDGGHIILSPGAGGGVGIGTSNPDSILTVNGSASKPGGGSWSSFSDRRLKKNIRPLPDSLDKLLALHGVSFEYIDPEKIHELSGERMGLIAQDVENVFPDWVETGPDGYKRVTYRGFEALTVEALRELRAENDAEIAILKRELAELKQLVKSLTVEKLDGTGQ